MSDETFKQTNVPNVYEVVELIETQWDVFAPGFYFSDETEQLNGPYLTKEAATQAFYEYCEHYL